METIRGRKSRVLDWNEFRDRLTGYRRVLLDLGTGDGRYVYHLAQKQPDRFIVGVDACRENLRNHSQARLTNMLFIIASAQDLPRELDSLASHIVINFPWGSLLESLLAGDAKLMNRLASVSQDGAQIAIRLNGGAIAEVGMDLETGTERICTNMEQAGWHMKPVALMDVVALRRFPTTWAKRLAYGRDPRALMLKGSLK
jgi:16S rRNA (adenine(1408)-N(1))-methyltransferase